VDQRDVRGGMDGIGKLSQAEWVAPLTAPQHQRGRRDPPSTADGYDTRHTGSSRSGCGAGLLDARIAAVLGRRPPREERIRFLHNEESER
jgi:hypothetical protein